MSFITLTEQSVSSGDASLGFETYISPPPPGADLPTVWVDLHLSGAFYQKCEDDLTRRALSVAKDGRKYVIVRPRRGVRLVTQEAVGTNRYHCAVVVNVASRAKHGLIVAPGKVD